MAVLRIHKFGYNARNIHGQKKHLQREGRTTAESQYCLYFLSNIRL